VARRGARAEHDRDRFFASALDLLGIAGFDGRFQRVNPAFMRVLGWSEEELTRQPFVSFVHPDDVAATAREAGRLAEGAETVGFENRYRCKDGTWRWLMWSSTADTGRGLIYAVARDITERKRMEDELRAKQAELTQALADMRASAVALERSNRELREFAHVASHDLQEPLRMVSSYCAMLAESYRGKLDAGADEMIAFAIDGAKRMQVLIQDLLAYARVENRGVVLERVALRESAAEAVANLRGAIEEARGEVTIGELPEVTADPRLMTQLLQNLIGNALKYHGDADPRVSVSARRIDGACELAVADNGIGIAPRHHERIFGMFKRLHGRDRYSGNGIGLAICKKIAELHGGRIHVESVLGDGATFRITIPDAPAGAAATETVP
jgi:PAS domain S-box-containing protein